jgi:hypothetical protein
VVDCGWSRTSTEANYGNLDWGQWDSLSFGSAANEGSPVTNEPWDSIHFWRTKADLLQTGFWGLLLLGPMAPQQLIHIKRVHVVLQPLFKTQVMVASRLDLPHYQAIMNMIKASKFLFIIIYWDGVTIPDSDDDFVYVRSDHSGDVDILLATIDFHVIGCGLLLTKPMQSML